MKWIRNQTWSGWTPKIWLTHRRNVSAAELLMGFGITGAWFTLNAPIFFPPSAPPHPSPPLFSAFAPGTTPVSLLPSWDSNSCIWSHFGVWDPNFHNLHRFVGQRPFRWLVPELQRPAAGGGVRAAVRGRQRSSVRSQHLQHLHSHGPQRESTTLLH